jgi:hypothetical protein
MTVGVSQNLSITVMDKYNLSISGASVKLNGAGISLTGITDNNGFVTFKNITALSTGTVMITAEKAGYQSASAAILVKLPGLDITVKITGKAGSKYQKTARVTVKSSVTEKALKGASVVFSGVVNKTLTTPKSGAVSLKFKGTGELVIVVSKTGYDNWGQIYQIK